MPLSATVDGQRVISVLLTEDEWADLRRRSATKRTSIAMRCGWPGHAKTRQGTRFFAHNKGGDGCSAGESAEHLAGKAAIVRWVHDHYPHLHVDTEVPVGNRDRIADVMVTWPTGQRVAIEIQYANLPLDTVDHSWEQRTRDYLDHDITPVWLLGSPGTHLRHIDACLEESQDGRAQQVRLSSLHQHMTKQEHQVLWIDPDALTITTPSTTKYVTGHPTGSLNFDVVIRYDTPTADIRADPLALCQLDPEFGLITPRLRHLIANEPRWHKATREAHDHQTAIRQRQEEARRRQHEARLKQRAAARALEPASPQCSEVNPPTSARGPAPPPVSQSQGPWTHCRLYSCRLPLDPILQRWGYHLGCEPVPLPPCTQPTPPAPDPQGSLF